MKSAVHILLLEDSDSDAALIEHTLRGAGVECKVRRVVNEPGFRAALADAPPHVVLSDYNMPGFRGDTALAVAGEFSTELQPRRRGGAEVICRVPKSFVNP